MIYISGQVHCKLQGVSYVVSERHELWSANDFKLEVSFHPSVSSAFHFIATLRRRRSLRSANGTQPNFVKRWTVNRANNLAYRKVGVVAPEKIGGQTTSAYVLFFDDFETSWRISAEWNATYRIGQGHWKVRRVSYVVPISARGHLRGAVQRTVEHSITQNNHDKNYVNHVNGKTAKYTYVPELQDKHRNDRNALRSL